MNAALIDEMDIPAFLKVDAAEAKRRQQWWEEHPPQAVAWAQEAKRDVDPDVAAWQAREEAKEKAEANARFAMLRAREGRGPKTQDHTGMIIRNGRWVRPVMTQSRYDHITGELKAAIKRSKDDALVELCRSLLETFARMFPIGSPLYRDAAQVPGATPVDAAPKKSSKEAAAEKRATWLAMMCAENGATLNEMAKATSTDPKTIAARIGEKESKLLAVATITKGADGRYRATMDVGAAPRLGPPVKAKAAPVKAKVAPPVKPAPVKAKAAPAKAKAPAPKELVAIKSMSRPQGKRKGHHEATGRDVLASRKK